MGLARRHLTALLALLALGLVLGASGCAGVETTEDVEATPPTVGTAKDEEEPYDGSCVPFRMRLRHTYHEGFLEWTPDGSQLLFNRGQGIMAAQIVEQGLRRLTPPGFLVQSGSPTIYGIYGELSPDGTQFVYSACETPNRGYEIAVVSLKSGQQQRLTKNSFLDHYPAWSPDGKRIAFISETEDYRKRGLYTMSADGTDLRRIAPSVGRAARAPPVWSPDGERIAFVVERALGGDLYVVYTVRPDGSELTRIAETSEVIRPPYKEEYAPVVPAWSPDGQFLAFIASNVDDDRDIYAYIEGGESEEAAIYTVRSDGTDLRQVFVLKPHGLAPVVFITQQAAGIGYPYFPKITQVLWSPDGTELLFFANGAHLINLDGSNLRRLTPPVLDGVAAWSPDGERIAVYEMGNAESPQVVWTAEGRYRTLHNETDERVLLTVARDGSDLQTLIEEKGILWLSRETPVEASVDLAVCKEGVVVSEPAAHSGLVGDCEALLLSRDRLSDTLKLRWNAETPLAEWEGVTLGGEPLRVHEVKLEKMNGVLPAELGQLSALRHLEIRGVGSKESRYIGARLSGGIPAELGNLQKLEVLDLSGNFLTGFIPMELSKLASLETLWLTDNFLSGSIPAELGMLTSLRSLSLGRNNLHGGIPAELGSLSQLQELHLWSNQLTGSIPPEAGDLSQLERLDLSENRLGGEIPAEMGNLSQLSELWLSSNRLKGSLPAELGDLSQLVDLYLTNNRLNGEIPPELGNLSQLERLHLSYNQLTGSIPAEMSNLSQLRWLELSANTFSGCVAAELPDLWVRESGLERCA